MSLEVAKYTLRINANGMIIVSMITIKIIFTFIIVTMSAPSMFKLICAASKNVFGNSSSTVPISFENLFNIRPEGFVLKNRIVAAIKLLNILSCKFCDTVTHIRNIIMDLVIATTSNEVIIPP